MKFDFFGLNRVVARKSQRKSSKKPMFPRLRPTFEQLEIRWMPSAVTLGLYSDTSIGAKFTSDGRLQGTISDPGYSVASKTVTFSGGVTGTTTTDANGYFLYTPTLSSQGAYNSIVASFTDHTSTGINSPSYSFTYDTVAPSVTLTAPGTTSAANFTVTASATDTNSLPDGTIVRIDVDLNNNGSFTNAGEQNYVSGILSSGSATITISPPLAAGTYPLRARVIDQAGNVGTSSTQTTVVNAWATSGQQRVNDPAQSTLYGFGQTAILPNTGSFLLFHRLDFDLSPGTSVGGNPALVYDSSTVNPKPIIEATLDSDPSGSVPTNISVQLTWNGGSPQTAVNFATTGHSAGDVYLLDAQVASAVTSTGAYSWSLSITETFSGSPNKNQTVTGTAYVVVSSSTNPFLLGWSLAGVDNLTTITGGVIWVSGSGGFRVFTGSSPYTSPANDFGSLVQNVGGSFTYTAKDGWTENFNSSGQETSLVDPHGLRATYTYSSARLANVTNPDGGLVTLTYSTGMGTPQLVSIAESGGRSVTTIRHMSNTLAGITDPDGSIRTFTYDLSNRLINDQFAPLNATYTYDGTTGLLSGVDRGLGTTLSLAPAASQGLAASPAVNANKALAVITDALSQLATYTLDSAGRAVQIKTPDGATQARQLDQAGQPLNYTDPLNRVTSYQYQYGSGKGDVKQITNPDASTVEFQYEGTFHHVKQFQDTLNRLTTMTYDGTTGDLLTTTNPLNQTSTQTWSSGLLQTVTDPLNHTTTFQYDGDRRLQVIKDALNDLTTLTYDSSGNPSTAKDALGHVTSTVYDSANHLTQVTNGVGGVTTLTYNASGEVTGIVDPLGNRTTFNYDQRGLLTAETRAYTQGMQQTATSAYDALGRPKTRVDGLNHTTTLTYDPVGRLKTVMSPVGAVESYTYDLAGEMTAYTDGLGHTTSYSYNSRSYVTQVQDALGNLVTTTYDTEGNVLSVNDARGNLTSFSYDALNRPATIKDALADVTTFVYDAAGNRIAVTDARGNTATTIFDALNRPIAQTDALNHTVTAVYDGSGNVIRAVDALGNATTLTYDSLNRNVTTQDPGGGVFTTVYDADSNVINTADALGHKATFAYDGLLRQTSATDPRGAVTTAVYDAANNVTSITDPVGNTTTFSYDAAKRLTQQTDPLNHSSTFAYDLANRLTSTTDRDGRRIDNTFDADNRLAQANWVISGTTVNTVTYSYDSNGNLVTATNNAGTYTMTYDAVNRVSQTQEPFGLTLTATYDAVGNRTQLQDSFGGVLTSVYDSVNRLTTREFGGTGQTPLREDLTYSARDQIATQTRYSDLAGTTKVSSTTMTYDSVGRLSNLEHFNAVGSVLANYTYTYDSASRDLTQTLNGATTTYSYDIADELTGDGTNNYTYDLNGNRTMTGYTTGTGNQLTNDGAWTYSYDAEGNLTKKSKGASAETWTFGYDNQNHMVWAKDSTTDGGTVTTLATYVYDALGNRIEKDVWTQSSGTTTTTRFGYDGQEIWVDLTTGNALQTRYIHGDAVDELFARVGSTGTAAWYLTDQLESVRDIVNNSGTVIDHLDYDTFGNITNETSSNNGDRYKWTGREFDIETGLQFNRARYFDPHAGRWENEDPLGFAGGDSNLYRYVANGPLLQSDPSGLQYAPPMPRPYVPPPIAPPAPPQPWIRPPVFPQNPAMPYAPLPGQPGGTIIIPPPNPINGGSLPPIIGGPKAPPSPNLWPGVDWSHSAIPNDPVPGASGGGKPPTGGGGSDIGGGDFGGGGSFDGDDEKPTLPSVNSRPHSSGTGKPPLQGPPNSIYTQVNGAGQATQNGIYDANGILVGHVDFKPSGSSPSGHGHYFPSGNPRDGHGPGAVHYEPKDLPPDWLALPPGVKPCNPIGGN